MKNKIKFLSIILSILFCIPNFHTVSAGPTKHISLLQEFEKEDKELDERIALMSQEFSAQHEAHVGDMTKMIKDTQEAIMKIQSENRGLRQDCYLVTQNLEKLEREYRELEMKNDALSLQLYGSCGKKLSCGACKSLERCMRRTGAFFGGCLLGTVITVVAVVIIGGIVFYVLKIRNPSHHSSGIPFSD